MSDIAEVLTKVKKLFALTSSSNENEAALAFEKAHKLLKEYNLSINDIQKDTMYNIKEETVYEAKNDSAWRAILMAGVAKANYCELLKRFTYNGYKQVLVGKDHNIVVAKEMIDYLIATIERLSKDFKAFDRVSFKNGISARLYTRLLDTLKQDIEECTSLVVQEKAMVDQYINSQNAINKDISLKVRNTSAYAIGYSKADNISLNKQVNQNNTDFGYIS